MSKRAICCSWFLLLLVSVHPVIAGADDARGVLPDGRAFRKDSEGNVLVDYIAELEVNVSSLTDRLHAAEDELQGKQREIDRLTAGKPASGDYGERDLLTEEKGQVVAKGRIGSGAVGDAKTCPPANCPQLSCPQPSCPPAPHLQCPPERECPELRDNSSAQLAGLEKEWRQKLSNCETEASTAKERLESERSDVEKRSESKVAVLEKQLDQLTEVLKDREGRIAELQSDVDEARHTQTASASRSSGFSFGSIFGRSHDAKSEQATQPPPIPPALSADPNVNRARIAAVQSVKGQLQTSLNQVAGTVQTRDRLFAEYGKGTRQLAVSPRKPVSKRGRTIPQIKQALSDANSMKEVSEIQREIQEIRSLMEEDMALLRRVGKLP